MSHQTINQLTTFYIGKELFGVEVMHVQEVASEPQVIAVPLAPHFVKGLINLRGQIATAIGLHELLGEMREDHHTSSMSVICKWEGNLVSLTVDAIGDVLEIENSRFEETPEILKPAVRKYLKGIYKMEGALLNVLNFEMLAKELSQGNERIGQ